MCWLDFTILGYKYGTSLIASISALATQLSSDPERRVGIILAPNCGEYGQEYTDSGIEKALNDVKGQLNDQVHSLVWRPFTLCFEDSSIHHSSKRPAFHMGFMCMSDQTMPDTGELKCHFLKVVDTCSDQRCACVAKQRHSESTPEGQSGQAWAGL